MKKKLFISLLVIIVLLAAVLGYAAMNASSLIARYKPDLERMASAALKSPVKLGDIDVGLFPAPRLHVATFSVGKGLEQISFKNLNAHLGLLPLLSGTLDIKELSLEKPAITFVRTQAGVAIAGLATPMSEPEAQAATAPKSGSVESESSVSPAPIGVNLERISIRGAEITLRDEVSHKSYQVTDLSLSGAVHLSKNIVLVNDLALTAKLFGKQPVSLSGKPVEFDLGSKTINAPDLDLILAGNHIHLSTVDLGQKAIVTAEGVNLTSLVPILAEFSEGLTKLNLDGSVGIKLGALLGAGQASAGGELALSGLGLNVGGFKVSDGTGNIALNGSAIKQQLSSQNLKVSVNTQPIGASFDAGLENGQANLNQFKGTLLGGTAEASGSFAIPSKKLQASASLTNINLESALALTKPGAPAPISGTLSRFNVSLDGPLTEAPLQSISGRGTVAVNEAELKGVNLAGSVLKAVNNLPFLAQALYGSVPESQRGEVDRNSTAIKSLTASFSLGSGSIQTPDLRVESTLFSLEAAGRVGFDSSLDLDATIYFTPAFSQGLVSKTKELSQLLDSSGRLVIPLHISGRPPAVVVTPNVEKLLKAGAQKALEQGASKLLDKALGKGFGKVLGF